MRLLAIAIVACLMASTADSGPTTNPSTRYEFKVVAASNDGELAIKKFQVASGVKVSLFAAEPMLANPVAISADEKGRFFVAETFRINEGIIDINAGFYDWAHWLDEDLACRSVGDRLAEIKRHRSKEEAVRMGVASERISMVEDRSGTGVADHSTVFADGFSGIVNGIGAGILARYGKVWYADLPDLWQLTEGPDGTAVSRRSLHYGFGVRVGFEGHDLHGLKMGLDGRIYFTMADRGASIHVGGKVLNSLDCGCVFRCNPDGSDLEIFATGLRNPQSLAFDQYGNLFTGDNNADHGDAARWVYVVEGATADGASVTSS